MTGAFKFAMVTAMAVTPLLPLFAACGLAAGYRESSQQQQEVPRDQDQHPGFPYTSIPDL